MADALFAQADTNHDGYNSSSYQSSSFESSTGGGGFGSEAAFAGAGGASLGGSSYESSSYSASAGGAGGAGGEYAALGGGAGFAGGDFSSASYSASSQATAVQQYATDSQGLFKDANPQIIRRPAPGGSLTYTQNIRVRFLQPPAVPPPGVSSLPFSIVSNLTMLCIL
jgi:hypothetical protein